MGEIPWQNVALMLLMQVAQAHPQWDRLALSGVAVCAEQIAVERGADKVTQRHVREAVAKQEAA